MTKASVHERSRTTWIGLDKLGCHCSCGRWFDVLGTDTVAQERLDAAVDRHIAETGPPIPLPTHITHAQILAVCETLGFDPDITSAFMINVSAQRVYVTRNERYDGRFLIVGDSVPRTSAEIPIQDEPPMTKRQRFAAEVIAQIQAECSHGDEECIHKGQIALARRIAAGEFDAAAKEAASNA